MGKPFKNELGKLRDTLQWVDQQDIELLHDFLCNDSVRPLISVGSGGSYSVCYYSSLLYKEFCGMATQTTPLALQTATNNENKGSKILFVSASGNNKDILQAVKKGIMTEDVKTASLCTSKRNKISQYVADVAHHTSCHYSLAYKDGYLATNSLLAFFGLLYRSYKPDVRLAKEIQINSYPYELRGDKQLVDFDYFVVLYSRYSEAVAYDIESKLSEAGLGAVLVSDYRNFGHGRHNWLDKKGEKTCVLAIVTPSDKLLAQKTIECFPKDIPVLKIETKISGVKGTIDLLWKSFYFVADLGAVRGIDPGCPGVPDYGTELYRLSYLKLIDGIYRKDKVDRKAVAILRKLNCATSEIVSVDLWSVYSSGYEKFVKRLKEAVFEAIVFDYDGTLSSSDKKSRYANIMDVNVKNALIRLLKAGISMAVVTGRGKSIAKILNQNLSDFKSQIYVGYYNGACVCPLTDDSELKKFKDNKIGKQLLSLKDNLLAKCEWIEVGNLEERNCQLTITTRTHIREIASICREIILSQRLDTLQVWESSHSLDVVVRPVADKRNIMKIFPDSKVLCIGDSGDLFGNDFQLLSTPFSLSVDKTSLDPDSCWNLAPEGVRGVEAALWYLSKIVLKNNVFKMKL